LAFNITFYRFKNQTEVSKAVDPNDKMSYSIYISIYAFYWILLLAIAKIKSISELSSFYTSEIDFKVEILIAIIKLSIDTNITLKPFLTSRCFMKFVKMKILCKLKLLLG
jgi:hypothetical protein